MNHNDIEQILLAVPTALNRYLIPPLVDIIVYEYYLRSYPLKCLQIFECPLAHITHSDNDNNYYRYNINKIYTADARCNVPVSKLYNLMYNIDVVYCYGIWNDNHVLDWNCKWITEGWDHVWCTIGRTQNGVCFVWYAYATVRGLEQCGRMTLRAARSIWALYTYCCDEYTRQLLQRSLMCTLN